MDVVPKLIEPQFLVNWKTFNSKRKEKYPKYFTWLEQLIESISKIKLNFVDSTTKQNLFDLVDSYSNLDLKNISIDPHISEYVDEILEILKEERKRPKSSFRKGSRHGLLEIAGIMMTEVY